MPSCGMIRQAHTRKIAPVADQGDMVGCLVLEAICCNATGLSVGRMACASIWMAAPPILDIFVARGLVFVAPERDTSDGVTKIWLL